MTIKIIHNDDTEERIENVLSIAFNDGCFAYSVTAGEAVSVWYDRENIRLVVVI